MPKIKLIKKLKATINLPADKSISHRAVIFSSLCKETTKIKPFLCSEDTTATLNCLRRLGIKIKLEKDNSLTVTGKGMYFPKKSKVTLYAKESGTTMRILSGLLAAQKIPIEFLASPTLQRRPMKRIVKPLRQMNANITGCNKKGNIYPPLLILPSKQIKGKKFNLSIASAQVKSSLILASLYADKPTTIKEPYQSRDHTERMLKLFGASFTKKGTVVVARPTKKLISPKKLRIPSDFSAAAFFIVLGLIVDRSRICIRNINLNPTRCGLLYVLKRMGAKIKIKNRVSQFEPYADVLIESSSLKATTINEKEIPSMIDEIPILCVAASFAKGVTRIKGIKELKVKETDRISAIVLNLKKAGVKIEAKKYKTKTKSDWMIEIKGCKEFRSAKFLSFSDHRTAMSLVVLGSIIGGCSINETQCINKSFPDFMQSIKLLQKNENFI